MEPENIKPEVAETYITPGEAPRKEYKLYRRRWFGLFVIVILNLFCTGVNRLTFTATPEISERWFNLDSVSLVNLTVILQYVMYVVAAPFTGYSFEKWGLKKALIFAGIINVLGCWIRYFGAFLESTDSNTMPRYLMVLIGHLLSGIGQAFFNNATSKYSSMWFDEGGRGTAMTIGNLGNPLSAALASVALPALISDETDIKNTLLILAIVSTVCTVPAFVMDRHPPSPPSASAEIFLQNETESDFKSFVRSVKAVLKNRNYLIILGTFSVLVSLFNTLASYMNQFTKPYGYSEDDSGIFAAALIGTGIIGAAISGPLVDKFKIHKPLIKLFTPLIAASYVALIWTIRENSYALIAVNCAAQGFFSFALLPISFELSTECTYPNPPSTSSSLNWIGGDGLSVIVLGIVDLLRDESTGADPPENMKRALIFMGMTSSVAALSVFFYNSPNLRMEAEKAEREQREMANKGAIL